MWHQLGGKQEARGKLLTEVRKEKQGEGFGGFLILPGQLMNVIIHQLFICFLSSDRLCLCTCKAPETFCFLTQMQWKALCHWTGLDGHLIALHLCAW